MSFSTKWEKGFGAHKTEWKTDGSVSFSSKMARPKIAALFVCSAFCYGFQSYMGGANFSCKSRWSALRQRTGANLFSLDLVRAWGRLAARGRDKSPRYVNVGDVLLPSSSRGVPYRTSTIVRPVS